MGCKAQSIYPPYWKNKPATSALIRFLEQKMGWRPKHAEKIDGIEYIICQLHPRSINIELTTTCYKKCVCDKKITSRKERIYYLWRKTGIYTFPKNQNRWDTKISWITTFWFWGSWGSLAPHLVRKKTSSLGSLALPNITGFCLRTSWRIEAMPLNPNSHEKWGFSTPKLWVITPKNEGYGFPWCLLSPSLFEAANIELACSATRWCCLTVARSRRGRWRNRRGLARPSDVTWNSYKCRLRIHGTGITHRIHVWYICLHLP